MKRILIFGNSGSGKSTLAKKLCQVYQLNHLDLDNLAWLPNNSSNIPPNRKPLEDSLKEIQVFINTDTGWVIEGCYGDLLEMVFSSANEMIFMNLPIEKCIANAKNRPWEPHKYDSKQAQDANLDMLINWISDYPSRTDTFSEVEHSKLYQRFSLKKSTIKCNNGYEI
ncbi:MAG: shikimate kinase [Proteobacteria bacterium]|nr:shikimate kinase [Pseudomonadota bacterium]